MTDANRSILKTVDLRKTFKVGKVEVPALRGVNVDIRAGEFVSIMGPSGCGKSTLLHLLGGLCRPSAGKIILDGTDLSGTSDAERTRLRRNKIGFVFQRFNLLPTLTVQGNLEIARQIFGNGHPGRQEIAELLEVVGLAHKLHHKPLELSVGEQQRVAVARALVNHPAIILADEPTGNLDPRNKERVLDILVSQAEEHGSTLLTVTHDHGLLDRFDRVLDLSELAESGADGT